MCARERVCEHEKDRLRVSVHVGSQLLVSAEGTRAGAQQGRQPGLPLSSEVEVSLGVWGQLAIFKGWGHAGACLNPCADFLWGLIPCSAREPLEKGQSSWEPLGRPTPQPLAGNPRVTEPPGLEPWELGYFSGPLWAAQLVPGLVVHSCVVWAMPTTSECAAGSPWAE